MMKQQILLLLLFINIFLSSFCHSKKIEEPRIKKPNVIFIVADDLGFSDVGFRNNNEIHTPNINEFAQQVNTQADCRIKQICRIWRKWCQRPQLGASLPRAPGVRITVVQQTPSN